MPRFDENRQREMIGDGWVLLKEPKTLGFMILASFPFMILNLSIPLLILNFASPVSLRDFGINAGMNEISFTLSLNYFYFIGIFLVLLFHEVIHLVFIPNFIESKKTFLGIRFGYGFVYSEENIPRNRYLLVTLAPFLIISAILPMLIGKLGFMNPYIKFLVFFNAMGSSVDVLNILITLIQVPTNTVLTMNGMRTYWRRQPECSTGQQITDSSQNFE